MGDFLKAKDLDDFIINEWVAVNTVLFSYINAHPDTFLAVRHIEMSLDPVDTFKTMYHWLDLPFTPHIKNRIDRLISSTNRVEPTKMVDLVRDSSRLPFLWKEKLTLSEIDKIRKRTEPLEGQHFQDGLCHHHQQESL